MELPPHDDGYSLRRLVRTDTGMVFRETIVPDSDVRDLISTVLLNHQGSSRAESAVEDFLLETIPPGVPQDQVQVVRLPTGDDAQIVQFGYQYDIDVRHLQQWDELGVVLEAFLPLIRECLDSSGTEVTARTFADLRTRGLRVVQCERCEQPLTDGHPDWKGVWVSLGDLGGPSCERSMLRDTQDIYSIMVPGPHSIMQS